MHFPYALTLISRLMITTFDKLHMFSKTFDCPFVPFSVFDSSISFTPRLLFWLWCDSLHRESVQTTENQLDAEKEKEKKKRRGSKFNNVTFRVSEARENKPCARAFSPPVSARPQSASSQTRARVRFCIVQWAVLLRPASATPGLIIEPIQNGVNG